MNESFLHYIWQLQYFDKKNLVTTNGEEISVLKTGTLNTNSGPDFQMGKVRIGKVEWIGNIEVHVKSSDWYAHHHETDQAYENVVLHLVWENDKPVFRNDQSPLPVLELKGRVDESLWHSYKKLINSTSAIACEKLLPRVDRLIKLSMLDKSLMQRLEAKADSVIDLLHQNKGSWEEVTYQILSKNFGFKINTEPMFQLSKSLPYIIIQKQNHLMQVEALLFGQAGMLEVKLKEDYPSLLFREYHLLEQKFSLHHLKLKASQWKFLRMRPANFPTLRLAQFASILFHSKNIFSKIISAESYPTILKIFSHSQSEYWKTHYRFGQKAKGEVAALGEASVQNIVINSVAPLLVAYGRHKDDQQYADRAVALLQQIPAEKNTITNRWKDLDWKVKNAFDSQALIELHNNFCMKRQCLNCDIGASILKPQS
ncbi:MAG: DUF2851 family protein [Bacteroidetes bacterium]|nr:DUF2851 family protein [Bacteroidota bacterium]